MEKSASCPSLDIGNFKKNYLSKEYMKQKKGFILREVCGEKVIIAEGVEVVNFNKLLSLNESAAYLWQQATVLGDFTAEQLADKLCEEYEVSKEQALHDVQQMLAEWEKIGIIG